MYFPGKHMWVGLPCRIWVWIYKTFQFSTVKSLFFSSTSYQGLCYKIYQLAPRGLKTPVKYRFMTDFYLLWLKLCGKYGNVKSTIYEEVNGSICQFCFLNSTWEYRWLALPKSSFRKSKFDILFWWCKWVRAILFSQSVSL